jgi:hypothetical protein
MGAPRLARSAAAALRTLALGGGSASAISGSGTCGLGAVPGGVEGIHATAMAGSGSDHGSSVGGREGKRLLDDHVRTRGEPADGQGSVTGRRGGHQHDIGRRILQRSVMTGRAEFPGRLVSPGGMGVSDR